MFKQPIELCQQKECSLFGQPFVPPEVPKYFSKHKPTLWIVGEAPGEWEAEQGRPFVGRSGQLLRRVLTETGLTREVNLVITNACLCRPPDNRTPKTSEIEVCSWNLKELHKKYPPDLIIAAGKTAARALGLKDISVHRDRGKVFDSPFGKVMVVLHPAFILRQKVNNYYSEYKAHFAKARQLLFGGRRKVPHELVIPQTREELRELWGRMLDAAAQKKSIAFDYETFPLEWETHKELQAFGLNLYHPYTDICTVAFSWNDPKEGKDIAFAVPVKAVESLEIILQDQRKKYSELGLNPEKFTDAEFQQLIREAKKIQKGENPRKLHFPRNLLERVDITELLPPSALKTAEVELEKYRNLPKLSYTALKGFLESEKIAKIAHNIVFERKVSKHFLGADIRNVVIDTQLLAYLLDESRAGAGGLGYGLQTLVNIYLPEFEEYKKKFLQDDLLTYNAMDALVTLKLARTLVATLDARPVFEQTRVPKALKFLLEATELIADMELHGVHLATDKLEEFRRNVDETMVKVLDNIEALVGTREVTRKQFKVLFYNLYEHEPLRTDKGELKLSSDAIKTVYKTTENEKLKKLCVYLLTYKKLEKIKAAYLDKYPELLNKYSGKIHPSFHLTGTATGRLSSSNPNFQQVPKGAIKVCPTCAAMPIGDEEICPICGNTELKEIARLKSLVRGAEGNKIVAIDYSQMEVCVLADQSGDPGLIKAIEEGLDLHSYTASKIFGIPYEEIKAKKDTDPVLKKKRQAAKSVTFGILYGQTPQGLADKLGISVEEAEQIIESFYQQFPKVREWVERIHQTLKKYRAVWTPVGRIRRFSILNSEAFRQAQNFPIQSFASDITLSGAVEVNKQIKKLGAKVIGLVHDSIVCEVPEDKVDEVLKILEKYTIDYPKDRWNISVPLRIDVDVDETWK